MAVKKAKKRSRKAAKAPRSRQQNIPLVDIRAVDITWCSGKDRKLKKISVNLNKVAGFLWRYDSDKPIQDVIKPGRAHVPHTGRVVVVHDDCAPTLKFSSVPVGCWWDGKQWVCPDDLA